MKKKSNHLKLVASGKSAPAKTGKAKKTPRTKQPAEMSLEGWQRTLRVEYGRAQNFGLKNIGDQPFFSEFLVSNPDTKGVYRVAIRGAAPGDNYCSCPDFAVNMLGTCKHIEFTLGKLEKRRGAKTAFQRGFRPEYSEIHLRYGAERQVVFRPGESCPKPLLTLASGYFDGQGLLKPGVYGRFDRFLSEAGKFNHEVRCYGDALAFIAHVRDRAVRKTRIQEVFPQGEQSPAFDHLLKASLYPYQRHGALFAATAGRCLIADEMGLGKTVQAIAAVEILHQTVGLDRVLIVTPTSLKHQWKQEIERFTKRSVKVIEGLIAKRAEGYLENSFYKITNYDVIHRDREAIHRWAPELIILDEAQRIKNWKTRTAQSVKKLSSEFAIVLTGTPLENRLEELHSIVEFVDRFRLGPMYRFLAEHQHADEVGRVIGYRNLGQVAQTLQTILVRRTRQEVLKELPERIEKRFFVPMTQEQMAHHTENQEIVSRLAAKWRKYRFLSESDQRRLLIALQNMRMACDSSYLLDQKTDFGVKVDELVSLLDDILEQPRIKVVVFSQWLRMHELIIPRLREKNWEPILFHGGIPGPKRKDLIRRFKEDDSARIFLSTDAGGVGLNLQNASVVVNMEQPWNPAILEQRIGRVHRLGQKLPVNVIHFISQGTIEHGMLSLLKFKKSMFAGVLDGGQDEVFLGGTRLKRFMESVEKVTKSVPAAMPLEPKAPEKTEMPRPDGIEPGDRDAGPDRGEGPSWQDVIAAGLELFNKLSQAVQAAQTENLPKADKSSDAFSIHRDEKTGKSYLKLPMPEPELLLKAADLLAALAGKSKTKE